MNKTPIEAYKEKKLEEFDEKFDLTVLDVMRMEEKELSTRFKSYLSSALDGLVSQIREEVVDCLPERNAIAKYVERNDISGLAEYVNASNTDVLSVLGKK